MKEFSLLGFIGELAAIAAEVTIAEHEALERGAEIIEAEAKASIGQYQPQSGPFAEWPELAEATKDDRARQGYPENEPELRSGAMRDSIEHAVVGREAHIGSDSEILEWQELGTSRMPPRSILGGAAARKADEAVEAMEGPIVAALVGAEVHQRRLPIR